MTNNALNSENHIFYELCRLLFVSTYKADDLMYCQVQQEHACEMENIECCIYLLPVVGLPCCFRCRPMSEVVEADCVEWNEAEKV
jgi:hypothetical protein